MDAAEAQREFERLLRSGEPAQAERLAEYCAQSVVEDCQAGREWSREAVTMLCEMAGHPDPNVSKAGIRGLFPGLVERLNDSFDERLCRCCNVIFAQVIDFHRRQPGGEALDEALRGFGIEDEAGLVSRRATIARTRSFDPVRLRRVLLLSRVTIGADVMINGTLISKLRRLRPDLEITLIGSGKLRELYGGDPLIRFRETPYERGGNVLSRLLSWIGVVEAVRDEIAGLEPDQFLIIDPDSRLTQLGLLPLDDRSYLYFESRSWPGAGSLGRLASDWLGTLTGDPEQAFPFIALPDAHREFGEKAAGLIRRAGHPRIVTISLGVGGNESKRVSDEFENRLVLDASDGAGIILDKGATPSERRQIDRLLTAVRSTGRSIIELNEENQEGILGSGENSADVLTWDGGIGRFAGLIAAADQYIGYDSAGQHIAAALGTPCRTIFVTSNSEKFAERWRPYGRGEIKVESRK